MVVVVAMAVAVEMTVHGDVVAGVICGASSSGVVITVMVVLGHGRVGRREVAEQLTQQLQHLRGERTETLQPPVTPASNGCKTRRTQILCFTQKSSATVCVWEGGGSLGHRSFFSSSLPVFLSVRAQVRFAFRPS